MGVEMARDEDFGGELDTKASRPLARVVADFKYQASRNSCYPNGIHNILKELSQRHDVGFALSESKVNQLAGYDANLGPKLERVVPAPRDHLKPYNYGCRERRSATFEQLRTVLRDEGSSFPLITVSNSYFKHVADRYTVKGPPWDHVLVVLCLDEKEFISWDPYAPFLPVPRGGTRRSGLVQLATGQFLELWENAEVDPSWMLWVFRERTQPTSLMDFNG
jgi:hypothetical protein